MNLYHYFDKRTGPFMNLSDLSIEEAEVVLHTIKKAKPQSFCARRDDRYLEKRRKCEQTLRTEFARKGGIIERTAPHYLVVEHSPWLSTWYEDGSFIKIPI